MDDELWYSAKCVFEHNTLSDNPEATVYEERIVLVQAASGDEAIEKAEREAIDYASGLDGVSYLGFVDTFHLFASEISEGSEIYSIMRTSCLSSEDFIDRYYDDGTQHSNSSKNIKK